jgi:DNA-binding NtrC family response regulator
MAVPESPAHLRARPDGADPGIGAAAGEAIVFADPQSRSLASLLERIAPADVPVMISGETGTGKERLARHIHQRSGRRGGFAVVHCSSLSLASTELGGDAGTRGGALGASDRGTLFFDDVGDLSPGLQCELLRLLRNNGPTDGAPWAQTRIITSTSTELSEAVLKGHFRRDLFYRLAGAPVKLLPLRQRPGDIVPLANHFLRMHVRGAVQQPPRLLGQDAIAALRQYRWPGNVRELENVIRLSLLTTSERELTAEDFRLELDRSIDHDTIATLSGDSPHKKLAGLLTHLLQNPGAHLYDDVEGLLVAEAFRTTGGNQVHTATLLGISRNVVRTLLKKHGLLKPSAKRGG